MNIYSFSLYYSNGKLFIVNCILRVIRDRINFSWFPSLTGRDSLLKSDAKLNPIVTLPSCFSALQTVFLFLLSFRIRFLTPFHLSWTLNYLCSADNMVCIRPEILTQLVFYLSHSNKKYLTSFLREVLNC